MIAAQRHITCPNGKHHYGLAVTSLHLRCNITCPNGNIKMPRRRTVGAKRVRYHGILSLYPEIQRN